MSIWGKTVAASFKGSNRIPGSLCWPVALTSRHPLTQHRFDRVLEAIVANNATGIGVLADPRQQLLIDHVTKLAPCMLIAVMHDPEPGSRGMGGR